MPVDYARDAPDLILQEIHDKQHAIIREIRKFIVGSKMDDPISFSLMGLFLPTDPKDQNCHILFEGHVGVAKTLLCKSLADAIDAKFSRIQFTPDLIPSDITGSDRLILKTQTIEFVPGPIFANIVLADEINRAPTKTQSALLEAMPEGVVTYAGRPYSLPQPFMVVATQNPVEQEGTYRTPVAQADRFVFKVNIEHPEFADELTMLQQKLDPTYATRHIDHVATTQEVVKMRESIGKLVHVDQSILNNVVEFSQSTWPKTSKHAKDLMGLGIQYGASPRVSTYLVRAAMVHAVLCGYDYVRPEDIFKCQATVLRHRIIFERSVRNSEQIEECIAKLIEVLNSRVFLKSI